LRHDALLNLGHIKANLNGLPVFERLKMPKFQMISPLFMMCKVINFIDNSSDRPSITFRKSQLLAVQAFRYELGP
jgi:hypothetical protein